MTHACCVCNKSTLQENLVHCAKCKFYVHKECYGVVGGVSSTDSWVCQRCTLDMSGERCRLCPFSEGALKRTDSGGWAHILCAQYIPEVVFGKNYSMEPIILAHVPGPRFEQVCYICDEKGDDRAKRQGACMQCNVQNCVKCFHVTCGQKAGLLVAEDCDNRPIVDYYGFCNVHVRSQKPEKLPSVETLTSRQMREVSKILPKINSASSGGKPKMEGGSTGFKPMQPKVAALPLPFHGVHKQDSIIESPQAAGGAESSGTRKEDGPSLSTASSSTTSTPTIKLKRRSSSETDTAESEDLSTEPVVKAMQSLPEKGRLKISNQSAPDHEASDGAEQYNDLMDMFAMKEKKRKKCKSPESELSDYQPYPTEKPLRSSSSLRASSAHKTKRREKKKDPLRIRSLKSTIKSPHKNSHNSYLYMSPPKTPVKVQQSKLITGDKGYSPSTIVSKMLEETARGGEPEYRPCTGKPLLSLDTFFTRFREMAMQHLRTSCRRDGSRRLLAQLHDITQVNSSLAARLRAKSARLEQLRALKARLAVPHSHPLKELPPAAPVSEAVAKLLSTLHKPPERDTITAETWIEKETLPVPAIITTRPPEKPPTVTPAPTPATTTPIEHKPTPTTTTPAEKHTAAELERRLPKPVSLPPSESKREGGGGGGGVEGSAAAKEEEKDAPQIIIAGDPPVAYTYKDGALVSYSPETLQSHYTKVMEEQLYSKAMAEQQYKEKISAAYFEAQRRQYEGLLQHQLQTKMSATDYLTQAQAYLADPFASYYYAQQASRLMPSLAQHYGASGGGASGGGSSAGSGTGSSAPSRMNSGRGGSVPTTRS